ncbi:MAG TPA: DUF5916 domain-containing protein, partial [Candidatus Krumholzibacterium sp.]|nr:DUF5916 domain-containing protein [Candidatus Krumholzibacterium sp.]
SHTNNPRNREERITGSAGRVSVSRIAAEHWLWSAGFDYTSKRYNINDIGFFFSPNDYGSSASLTYKEDVPADLVRNYSIGLSSHVRQIFEGMNIFREVSLHGEALLSNYWGLSGGFGYNFGLYDHRETRGNGLYRKPVSYQGDLAVETDERNPFVARLSQSISWDELQKHAGATGLGIEVKPLTWARFEMIAEYNRTRGEEAWILFPGNTRTFGDRSTDSYNFTLRATLAFTREFTVEYYGQVFFARGHYDQYRDMVGDREFVPVTVTPGLLGANFNRQSLHSNLVLRWEYLPGSTMFLVWSQARHDDDGDYDATVRENLDNTFTIPPANVLLLKITYWWDV